jgi:hypothetical protein
MVMNRIFLLLVLGGLLLDSCCNEDFIIPSEEPEDYRLTAIDVTSFFPNSCSADFAYSTLEGSPAGNAGSCWANSGPLYTVWFKFTAPASEQTTIIIQVGDGEYGTQRKSLLALWDSDGTTELDCETYAIYANDMATIYMYNGNLTPGNVYYFSVDVMDAASRGTFKLCLTDSD